MSFLQLFSHSSFLYLLCFLFAILVEIQLSLSNPCLEPITCGTVTAQYPFWGFSQTEVCGRDALRLYCEDDGTTATIMMMGVKYRVLNVDYTKEVLRLVRHDMRGICAPDHLNTTIDSVLFDYSSSGYEMLTYSYSCLLLTPRPGNCVPDDLICDDRFIHPRYEYNFDCKHSFNFLVPKNLTADQKRIPKFLEQVLMQGFEVKWVIPSEKSFNKGTNIIIATVAGVLGIIVILSILLMSGLRQKLKLFRENDQNMEAFVRNYGTIDPKRYNYSDVKKMTKSFSNKLGQGGFGDVYKGKLPDGRLVAVKVFKGSKCNGEEFFNEVASISRTSHVNIVAFLGFCYERKKRALIYEFMPNGSLDKFIYDLESSSMNRKLEWGTMNQIAIGIARGLEYLHRGCNIRIVHFDIKPHNILLDEDFCPKISDFGLSKQPKKKESIVSMLDARGTAGYIAPEVFCRSFGGVSYKSDIYSYGMMILEMVGGRQNTRMSHTSDIYFPDSIYKRLEPGKDFELHGVVTEEEKEIAKKMILVSLWCIQTIPSHRPSMTEVVDMLEGSLENIEIPPKPSLSSPTRSPKFSSQTTSSPILAS